MLRVIFLTMLMVAIAGCNSAPRRDPNYAASYPAAHAPVHAVQQQTASGSIYQAGYDFAWFGDLKARRVGDVLTIQLSEATTASKSAETSLTRNQSSTITNPTLLGATPQFGLPGVLPLSNTDNNTLESSLSSDNDFSGESEADQSNSLTGQIAVTVAEVLPNGNLVVRGEKRINLNQGNEYVKISGIVRPVDITPLNTVSSQQVADATIVYNGDGAGADANRIGWISRFFVSAIFPF
ncbi:MAG: flagellar basal body L-ring protein FlgH [Pseudomonadota bacterium]